MTKGKYVVTVRKVMQDGITVRDSSQYFSEESRALRFYEWRRSIDDDTEVFLGAPDGSPVAGGVGSELAKDEVDEYTLQIERDALDKLRAYEAVMG